MYLLILLLPLLGSIFAGLLGRKLGVTGSQIITILCLGIASILSIIGFYEVGISNSPVVLIINTWFKTEIITINWAFLFDSVSLSFLLAVTLVSTLVHIYSTNYMANDPAMCSGKTFCGFKLSNSGDTLKLLVPNYIRKAVSGWSNYSCTVISQKMSENKIGNCGSKSDWKKNL